ncbi:MAG: glutamate cyclase domain-containing protein, partial [Porcipelethomonas sp.]
MRREEISRINLGNSLDKVANIDPRGYGVCNILYDSARKYTGYPLTMNAAEKLDSVLKEDSLVYILTGFVLPTHKKAEMDGIVSSMLLARALVRGYSAKPVIICPEDNMPAVKSLSAVMGLHLFDSIEEMYE